VDFASKGRFRASKGEEKEWMAERSAPETARSELNGVDSAAEFVLAQAGSIVVIY
jgi:hypothetical protein